MGTFTKLTYHVVFSTKYRAQLIRDEFRERLYEYIGGTIRSLNGHSIEIGGVNDHLHLLTNLPPTIAVSNAVRDIKANASKFPVHGLTPMATCCCRFAAFFAAAHAPTSIP